MKLSVNEKIASIESFYEGIYNYLRPQECLIFPQRLEVRGTTSSLSLLESIFGSESDHSVLTFTRQRNDSLGYET